MRTEKLRELILGQKVDEIGLWDGKYLYLIEPVGHWGNIHARDQRCEATEHKLLHMLGMILIFMDSIFPENGLIFCSVLRDEVTEDGIRVHFFSDKQLRLHKKDTAKSRETTIKKLSIWLEKLEKSSAYEHTFEDYSSSEDEPDYYKHTKPVHKVFGRQPSSILLPGDLSHIRLLLHDCWRF